MKKKTYQQPKMKVIQLDQTELLCTSGQQAQGYNEGPVTINSGEGITLQEEIWSQN